MSRLQALNFKKWIDEHRHLLKPPVGNKMVWAGPRVHGHGGGRAERAASDFHVNDGEEFFYQLEGDIALHVHRGRQAARTSPSARARSSSCPRACPTRRSVRADTVGLVIERQRLPKREGLISSGSARSAANELLRRVRFHLTDIVKQLPPIIEHFYGDETKLAPAGSAGT